MGMRTAILDKVFRKMKAQKDIPHSDVSEHRKVGTSKQESYPRAYVDYRQLNDGSV